MSVARNILKNPKLLPGGGATELTVSAALKQKSSSIEGIEKVITRLLTRVVCSHSLSRIAEPMMLYARHVTTKLIFCLVV